MSKIWKLERAADAREHNGPAWHVVMSAIENALEDHADGTEAFERAAMTSLESNLCFDNECTPADLAWFRSNGVEW